MQMPDTKEVARKTMAKGKNGLTKKQEKMMEEHAEHHSPEHIKRMRELMMNGMSFDEAHEMTQEEMGD